MFNSIFGTITAKFPQILHLETSSGIEWSLSVSESTLNSLATVGSQARVYTWMYHKEDAMKLFGFSSIEERSVFLDLFNIIIIIIINNKNQLCFFLPLQLFIFHQDKSHYLVFEGTKGTFSL